MSGARRSERDEAKRRGTRAAQLVALVVLAVTAAALPAHAFAAAGDLYAFGYNYEGQLGTTTSFQTATPNYTPLRVELPGATGPVLEAAAGYDDSLIVTSSGQLYAFGYDAYGQLGVAPGGEESRATPDEVALPAASGGVVQAAGGERHTLALTSAGQLFAFGNNKYGQLGNATGINAETANPAPALVTLPGAVGAIVQVAAGEGHSLAVTASGQLYAWGLNDDGQLGTPTNAGGFEPTPTPAQVLLPGATAGVVQVAAGVDHTLAMTASGQVYAFGYDGDGQLGPGVTPTEVVTTPTLVTLPPGAGTPVRVGAGGYTSFVITSTGQVYAFGYNATGELGTPATFGKAVNAAPSPVPLPGALGPAIRAGGGDEASYVLTAAGQLYSFGGNEFGQLASATNAGVKGGGVAVAGVVSLPGGESVETFGVGAQSEHALAVTSDLRIATGSLAAGLAGAPYAQQALAEGGRPPYTWRASGLPAGLGIDPASGRITGTPAAAGTATVVLSAADANGIVAGSGAIPLQVLPSPPAPCVCLPPVSLAERIRAGLLRALLPGGRAARIGTLRQRRRYVYRFTAIAAGTLTIEWFFLPRGARVARHPAPVLLAAGHSTFQTPGTRTLVVKLTSRGRAMLSHAAHLTVTARGIFRARGGPTVRATRSFKLAR
jgi:alpha-tubulin suppressor-like RCC1 family protein